MLFSQRPTSHLPIESQTLTIWLGMTLTLVCPWPHIWPLPQTSQTKSNCCPGSKISICHEMTLTLTQWPFNCYSSNIQTDTHIQSDTQTHTYKHTYSMKTLPLRMTGGNKISVSTASKVLSRTDTHPPTHSENITSSAKDLYIIHQWI